MGNSRNHKFLVLFALFFFSLIHTSFSQSYYVPELLYFKFRNNTGTSSPNFASSPVGNNPASITGVNLAPGGQFDTCMMGTGSSGSNGVNTGWNCNLGSGRWTLSFWVKNLDETSPGIATYLFGDPGASGLRCFYGGFATPNNILLRGPMTDMIIPCSMPGEYVFHFVYNGTSIKVYRNGVFIMNQNIVLNLPTGTGFRAGGYTGGTYSLNPNAKMDEFRLYNRALSSEEIAATWNIELPYNPTGISGNGNGIPSTFVLNQNYPNPFNPSTMISFAIPAPAFVNLSVTDLLGREVGQIVNEYKTAGSYNIRFDASGLASGVYFYKITAGNYTDTKRMTVLK